MTKVGWEGSVEDGGEEKRDREEGVCGGGGGVPDRVIVGRRKARHRFLGCIFTYLPLALVLVSITYWVVALLAMQTQCSDVGSIIWCPLKSSFTAHDPRVPWLKLRGVCKTDVSQYCVLCECGSGACARRTSLGIVYMCTV